VNSRTRPAFLAVDELEEFAPLRAWLFRIAHNRALDLLRSRAIRAAAHEVADPESPDPVEVLMRREAVETAVSRLHIGAAPLEHQSRRALPVWD
jgi:RNA polymerase sigma-70 factor (ECF subfamily)